jgi:glyoxylase-like metal-dependent hydrolase (beta-lactamase superfamily II)
VPDDDAARRARPTTWQELEPTEAELEELRRTTKAKPGTEHDQEEPGDIAFSPDTELSHGDVLAGGNWTLQTLHTPGHIANHVCFAFPEEQSAFTGDHIMGWSTSVVPSPEGSMRDYMRSLDLFVERDDRFFYPTHGPRIPEPIGFTRALVAHRHDRERQIVENLAGGPRTIPDLVTVMYRDTTPHILHMAAGQSVYSHLLSMAEDGRVASEDGEVTADSVFRLP